MNEGLVTVKSAHGFAATLERLKAAIAKRSLTLFAEIDHAAGARDAGLELAPTTLLIFGNAKGGTPWMQANQRAGIDLPLKALVWEDEAGVFVTVNDPHWIARRHELPGAVAEVLEAVLRALTEAATH
jgi:uncharacterized protein (DUF302 family)